MSCGKLNLFFAVVAVSLVPAAVGAKDIPCSGPPSELNARPAKLRNETLLAREGSAGMPYDMRLAQNGLIAAKAGELPLGLSYVNNFEGGQQVQSRLSQPEGERAPALRPQPKFPATLPKEGNISSGVPFQNKPNLLGVGQPRLGPDPRLQIPLSGQSAINALNLNRPTKSLSMCRLQQAYGIARPECSNGAGFGNPPSNATTCSAKITTDWYESNEQIVSLTSAPTPQLIRDYLHSPEQFRSKNSAAMVSAVSRHIGRTEALLDNCFRPLEDSPFEKRTKVLGRIGKVIVGSEPVCTAILVGTSQYILTARHCFSKLPATTLENEKLWFQPAISADRYQICAVAEPEALDAGKTADISLDQVLVRIAATAVVPLPVDILPASRLLSTSDENKGNITAPTLLTTVSFFPLATLVRPQIYKSGFVQDSAEVCAAIRTQAGCFSHVCNAVDGGSGAPIFLSDAQTLTLAGTYVGSSNENGLQCKSELNTLTNSAVSMNGAYAPSLFH